MKRILFLFLIFSFPAIGQELCMLKATMQTTNYGASPGSVTNYTILLEKKKKFAWGIDSICGIQSGQRVKYNLVKVNDANVLSPNYTKVEKFSKSDKGKYQITFGIHKERGGGGRPGSPPQIKADTTNIEGGVYIYYHVKKKKKKLTVDVFEMLERIDAP